MAGSAGAEQIHWAVIGVKVRQIRAEFVAGHEPDIVDGRCCSTGKFVPRDYMLVTEESVEVRRPAAAKPLTRDEFRALCDANKTKDAIIQALQAK